MMEKIKIRIPCPDGRGYDCGVCHHALLERDAYEQIHDRYYDTYGKQPVESVIGQIYKMLPREIILLGREWGFNDTEVREKIGKWMQDKIIITL